MPTSHGFVTGSLPGLSALDGYDVRVRALPTWGGPFRRIGDWSSSKALALRAPGGFGMFVPRLVQAGRLSASWMAVEGADAYEIRYRRWEEAGASRTSWTSENNSGTRRDDSIRHGFDAGASATDELVAGDPHRFQVRAKPPAGSRPGPLGRRS